MKYHLKNQNGSAMCGAVTSINRPDTFLYNVQGFTSHYSKEHQCKKCLKLLTMKQNNTNTPAIEKEGLRDDNIKKQMIDEAKNYSSESAGGITINDPATYKTFRAGQDSGYSISANERKALLNFISTEFDKVDKREVELTKQVERLNKDGQQDTITYKDLVYQLAKTIGKRELLHEIEFKLQ